MFIGRHTRLPPSEFYNVLLNMTEVGHFGTGRFRPSFYVLTLLEASTWGTNVHLWYLTLTLGFGVFIASLWWILSRFLQIWLGAALLFQSLYCRFGRMFGPGSVATEAHGATGARTDDIGNIRIVALETRARVR